jgi:hypothetical protein
MITKTVGDSLNLLKDLDPNTELWCQDIGDGNECWPIVNLPDVLTIAKMDCGGKIMWKVYNPNSAAFDPDEEIEETKQAVIWNE